MKALLEQVSSGLVVPDTALDLTALQDVIDKCKPDPNPPPSSPITRRNGTVASSPNKLYKEDSKSCKNKEINFRRSSARLKNE